MLNISIQGQELWDDEEEVFRYTDTIVLEFEHSLVSLSKWEAKFHKPFLGPDKKTEEEMVGYVQAMLLTPNVDQETLDRMTVEQVQSIDDYINDPMTGTSFSNLPESKANSERLSAELIQFWMSEYKIPYEARYWHLNQLFTQIRVHYAKNQPAKKMSKQARIQSMAELNAQRKKQLGSTG